MSVTIHSPSQLSPLRASLTAYYQRLGDEQLLVAIESWYRMRDAGQLITALQETRLDQMTAELYQRPHLPVPTLVEYGF